MKHLKIRTQIVLFSMMISFLISSCKEKEDNNEATILYTSPNEISFSYKNESKAIKIYSDGSWTIMNVPVWCEANKTSGNGNDSISITVSENKNTEKTREDILIIKAGSLSKEITVRQEKAVPIILSISSDELVFKNKGEMKAVELLSNADWTITDIPGWCTLNKEAGNGNDSIKITVTENKDTEKIREAMLTIKAGTISKTIIIQQEKAAPLSLSISPDKLLFKNKGETKTVKVFSNTDWTITNIPDWCTLNKKAGNGNDSINIATSEHIDPDKIREAVLTIKAGTISKTITIQQEKGVQLMLAVSPNELLFKSKAEAKTVKVYADGYWTVTNIPTWCTLDKASGNGNDSIKITVTENTSVEKIREAVLSVKLGFLTKEITIRQEKAIPLTLSVLPSELLFSYNEQTKMVKILSNADWSIIKIPTWCELSKTSGRGNDSINIKVSENTDLEKLREAVMTIKSGIISRTITVRQDKAASLFLSVSPAELLLNYKEATKTVEILTSGDWSITNIPDWCTLSKTTGSKNSTIYITVSRNTDPNNMREAVMALKAGDISKTITVRQDKDESLSLTVSPSELLFGYEKSTKTVEIFSNGYWDITDIPNWCTLNKTSGYKNSATSITVSENTDANNMREAVLTVKLGALSRTITIRQDKGIVLPSVVHIYSAGTLVTELKNKGFLDNSGNLKYPDRTLTVAGVINYTDLMFLKGLKYVDIENVTIEESQVNGNIYKRNTIPNKCFRSSALVSIKFPKSLEIIEDNAFLGSNSLSSIKIPENVKSIGFAAFSACQSLREIEIAGSITEYGARAFGENPNLTSVRISEGNTIIGEHAFKGCGKLQEITMPNSLTEIRDYAFGNSGLRKLVIPKNVTKLGRYVFHDCASLSSVTIPASVQNCGDNVFLNCKNLITVKLEEGLKRVGEAMFKDCSGLTTFTLPQSMEETSKRMFEGCTSLQSIVMNNGLTAIGNKSFRGCTKLDLTTLPATVTEIRNEAFRDCINLKSMTIPHGVKYIMEFAFAGCSLTKVFILSTGLELGGFCFGDCPLKEVHVKILSPGSLFDAPFSGKDSDCVLYVPIGLSGKYQSSDWGSVFKNIVEE